MIIIITNIDNRNLKSSELYGYNVLLYCIILVSSKIIICTSIGHTTIKGGGCGRKGDIQPLTKNLFLLPQ